jgi:hypothetical protein
LGAACASAWPMPAAVRPKPARKSRLRKSIMSSQTVFCWGQHGASGVCAKAKTPAGFPAGAFFR